MIAMLTPLTKAPSNSAIALLTCLGAEYCSMQYNHEICFIPLAKIRNLYATFHSFDETGNS